jgi:pilus assembly protein CpaD
MKSLHHSALIGLVLALSACGGTTNRGVESVHQAVVARSDYVLDIPTSGDGLSGEESARLEDWLASLRVSYGDRISIEDRDSNVGSGLRRSVSRIVARFGLLVDDVAPVTAGEGASGMARVIVSRVTATVPGCPDWTRRSHPDFDTNVSSNFGCAINSNIAVVVANPQDLVEGREIFDAEQAKHGATARSNRNKMSTSIRETNSEGVRN